MKKIIIGVIIAVIGFGLWSASQSTDSTINGDKVVKIGVLAPLSGDAAVIGEEVEAVLSEHLKAVNAQEGAQFELVFEDGKCTGVDSVNAFQKLKDIDGVQFVLGGICSSETLAIAPLTENGEALVLSPGSSNPNVQDASPYVFSMSFSDDAIGKTLADQMKGYSRVAIISEQNDYNVGIKNVWEAAIAEHDGVEVVANEVFPKGNNSFRSLIAKVRESNPDAILLNPNAGVTAESLLKQLAEQADWTGYNLYSQIAYISDEVRSNAPELTEGMTIVDAPNLTDEDFLARAEELRMTTGNEFSNIGDYFVAASMDSLDVLTDIIREVGSDHQVVRDALVEQSFEGYVGQIDFGEGGFSSHAFEAGIYVVEDGSAVYQE